MTRLNLLLHNLDSNAFAPRHMRAFVEKYFNLLIYQPGTTYSKQDTILVVNSFKIQKPDEAKAGITAHLQSAQFPERFRGEINNIIEFMNRGASTDGNILRMRVRDLDRKRSQDMSQIQPEFAELIDYTYAT